MWTFSFKTPLNIVRQIGNMASTQPLEMHGRSSAMTAKPCTQQSAVAVTEKVADKLRATSVLAIFGDSVLKVCWAITLKWQHAAEPVEHWIHERTCQ